MTTSGTYAFQSVQVVDILEQAYQRIGVLPALITLDQILTAQRAMNFILTSWANRGNNLWTVKEGLIGLKPNQATYPLPQAAFNLKTVMRRTSNRNLGGTPDSSSGDAANAFDGNPATSCEQTAPNGEISYSWGAGRMIQMVGIQSATPQTYTILVQYSLDGATWSDSLSIPAQAYSFEDIKWFVIPQPLLAGWFRIMETGGSTLNITELYFNNMVQDIQMSPLGEYEYTSQPNKNQAGTPTSYWVDRQINPVINIWEVPTAIYQTIYFTYWEAIQDIGALSDTPQIPTRFLYAFMTALTVQLGIMSPSFPPEKVASLQGEAEGAWALAAAEDREIAPLRIYPNMQQGWGRL